ncbi:MAG: M23 family metallopeptidase, partial [Thermomicrobiales bacterium]|nr:M23 family metallopeptidase [Thermomicrobiales bacterium]
MLSQFTRRGLLFATAAAAAGFRSSAAQSDVPLFSYPVGFPGQVFGDGFHIRHAYAVENTAFLLDWWHTGENWYALGGESAGLGVYAAAAGEVAYVGSDYPGPVVIVRHADDLYSMYGHLAYGVRTAVGDRVARGQQIGAILDRTDGRSPSHLHFEFRTFLTTPDVNGDAPSYGYACGYQCPPGPGYWPMSDPRHPSEMGWRNPTHVINRRMYPDGVPPGAEIVITAGAGGDAPLWSLPPDMDGAERVGALPLQPGGRYPLLEIDSGPEASRGTSAKAYRVWYRITTPTGDAAWLQAVVPSTAATG